MSAEPLDALDDLNLGLLFTLQRKIAAAQSQSAADKVAQLVHDFLLPTWHHNGDSSNSGAAAVVYENAENIRIPTESTFSPFENHDDMMFDEVIHQPWAEDGTVNFHNVPRVYIRVDENGRVVVPQ